MDGLQVKDTLAAVLFSIFKNPTVEELLSQMSKRSKHQNTQKVKHTLHAMLHKDSAPTSACNEYTALMNFGNGKRLLSVPTFQWRVLIMWVVL